MPFMKPMAIIEATAPLYDGKIKDYDPVDMAEVTFPSIPAAVVYIQAYNLIGIARIQSDGNGVSQVLFDKPVVIEFDIAPKLIEVPGA